ncbi:probable ribosome-binding factor A, chloroplastic [Selaginella moellendorffii]|nr:probable ribosome-binding factor A, chloroplastic [Selaginella moellendorffii]|eukprot:XP_002987494.2 probable ribosome-binding factor A, chloroplastic [Selaginella moellendorffii]
MAEILQCASLGRHFQVERSSLAQQRCGFPASSSRPAFGGSLGLARRRNGLSTVCMAHPRRIKMVAQQIRREVGEMLIKDKVLMQAILPEAALGADLYLSSVTTISDVEISRDLQVAKIYISVFGDERGKEIAIEGLKSREKYVRMQLGKRMKLRLTPEVRFIADDSFERGARVIKLLDRLKEEAERKERGETIPDRSDDEDSDFDDDDEEIIFVE